jgi:hypothetical protein
MRIKQGVKVQGIKPEILLALQLIDGVYRDYEYIITSVWRERGPKSLHPYGYAVDFIYRGVEHDAAIRMTENFKKVIGEQYDLIYHDAGSGYHWHLEYDPR